MRLTDLLDQSSSSMLALAAAASTFDHAYRMTATKWDFEETFCRHRRRHYAKRFGHPPMHCKYSYVFAVSCSSTYAADADM